MRKSVLLIFLFLAVHSVFAQKDTAAQKILDKVAETYQSYGSFRVDFELIMENKEADIREVSKGKADIKGSKYKVCLMGTETYFDGKLRYSYIKDAQEVNISEISPDDESMMNPAKIFEIYKKGFDYSVLTSSAKSAEIKLIPHDKNLEYIYAVLAVNKENNNINSFKTIGKDGSNVIISITKLEKGIKFTDSHFVFDTKSHSDVEVIDMR